MTTHESFTSRWALLIAALGMAVGTGNIWRFPRILANQGGGAFLIPWLIFLFLWAIPLLMVEMAMGRSARKGVVGAFGRIMGRQACWMGAFVGWCTMAITFYYTVVAGWCIKYFVAAAAGNLNGVQGTEYWDGFQATVWQPVMFHVIAMAACGFIVYRGVAGGIERASKVLIPALFVLLAVAAIRALTLPAAPGTDGPVAGLNFIFNPHWPDLLNYEIWLQALTQSAWSTGAGWGLMVTYAVYSAQKDDIVGSAMTIGLGNNSASILAAMAIIPTVFAVLPHDQATAVLTDSGPASTGLSFIWVPELFSAIPAGQFFMSLFFLALVVAAFSSLIAMLELGVRIFMDFGMTRHKAVMSVATGSVILGIPSAVNLSFFSNQDAVWGIGLMVSGFFFALAARKFGVARFREQLIEPADNDIPPTRWFDFAIGYLVPLQFTVLIVWWLYQAATSGEAWWNPFGVFTLGTCLFQWGVVLVIFYLSNNRMAEATFGDESAS
ncbi:MAG: sodium-dependent transporter [Acidobacteriota bacterium]|jgi:NSS family neurotransmitter:Na+ symporter